MDRPKGARVSRDWQDGHWTSADGLRLHYRDYPGRSDRPPILCIPGLTRNARDFEPVADCFGGEWRIISVNLRGRGDSDYAKESASYTPAQYVADIAALLDQVSLGSVVAIGTSLGGIVAMLLAAQDSAAVAALVLNDIGPEIEEAGLARIRDYVGQGRSYATWMHAARALREQAGEAHPDFVLADWLTLAKRLMCLGGSGRITFDYDMKIAEPFAQPLSQSSSRAGSRSPLDPPLAQPVPDLWAALRSLTGRPVLALRGELSDLLSVQTLARMQTELPGLEAVTVPRTGHVPTLEEPAAQAAIARLLAQVA